MADEWIKWRLYPEHPKVQRIAFLTGDDPERVCGKITRWFRYVDQHYEWADDEVGTTGLSADAIHDVLRWKRLSSRQRKAGRVDYVEAMQDEHVHWLEDAGDGTYIVVDHQRHFGQSAKRRSLDQRRKAQTRRGNVRDVSASNADKRPHAKRTSVRTTGGRNVEPELERELEGDASASPPPKPPAARSDNGGGNGDWRSLVNGHPPQIPPPLNTPEFREAWAMFVRHRHEKRQKLTATAADQALRKLENMGHDRAIAAIKHSVANGWQGIHEPDGSAGAARAPASKPRPGGREADRGEFAGDPGEARKL